MVTENVRCTNEEPPRKEESPGTEYARECLDLLRDLSAEQLAHLRGILLKASFDSLGGYYTGGYLEGVQTVSVLAEDLSKLFSLSHSKLMDDYVFDNLEGKR